VAASERSSLARCRATWSFLRFIAVAISAAASTTARMIRMMMTHFMARSLFAATARRSRLVAMCSGDVPDNRDAETSRQP
jgi:hypothetical protein